MSYIIEKVQKVRDCSRKCGIFLFCFQLFLFVLVIIWSFAPNSCFTSITKHYKFAALLTSLIIAAIQIIMKFHKYLVLFLLISVITVYVLFCFYVINTDIYATNIFVDISFLSLIIILLFRSSWFVIIYISTSYPKYSQINSTGGSIDAKPIEQLKGLIIFSAAYYSVIYTIYILTFALSYTLFGFFYGVQSYNAIIHKPSTFRPDFFSSLYFSIITQTTVGYGDLSPANNITKILASTQALIGSFAIPVFLAILILALSENLSLSKKDMPAP